MSRAETHPTSKILKPWPALAPSGDGLVSQIIDGSKEPQPASGSACGKAIIIGEHAVVYGARAVAIPLKSLRFGMELKPKPKRQIHFQLAGKDASDLIKGTIRDGIQALQVEDFGADIEAHSTLPIGAGLGSSAALCIATLKTLSASFQAELPKLTLAKLGNALEKRFHGNPSGLDTAVVAYETAISFTKPRGPEAIAVNPDSPFAFALIDSGVRASTLTMIEKAKPYFTSGDGDQRIARFDALANRVILGLQTGNQPEVASAMNEAAVHLDAAGVVNDSLRQIIATAKAAGVLAVKPTGAGGGGCVMCLLDPSRAARQMAVLKQKFSNRQVFEVTL